MSLVLNEDQEMLKDTVRGFCRDQASVKVLRHLRDTRDPLGYSKNLWSEMCALGWAGMAIPEDCGGFGFGYGGLGIVLEETGRTLFPSPLVATVLLGATAINLGGSKAQKQHFLPAVASGELLLALALEETAFHNPARIVCRAEKSSAGFKINGNKTFVLDGHIADKLILVARTSGETDSKDGISLFIVDNNSAGLHIDRTWMADSRNTANIRCVDVEVTAADVLGEIDKGYEILEKTLDIGRIGLAAEMLGSIQEVFERTMEYLKQRQQFGVVLGSFQALQHRAALMYSEIELCRSAVRKAFSELDGTQENIPDLASIAKSKLSEVFELVSNEAVQLHGGIGMTDEFDIGFYLKRARVVQQCLGDAAFHRDRYATLNGF